VAEHRWLTEVVDDDADQLYGVAHHQRLGGARVEDAAGDRLGQSLRRHGIVFTVVDYPKPRPKQQSNQPLCCRGQRSNNAAKKYAISLTHVNAETI